MTEIPLISSLTAFALIKFLRARVVYYFSEALYSD
jgi:hypothetical protein